MLNDGLVAEEILRIRVGDGVVVEEEHIDLDRCIRDVTVVDDGAISVITEGENGEVLYLPPPEEG